MNAAKQHAAVWLAFSAGMFADATENAARFTDEQIPPGDAEAMFRVAAGDALDALGLDSDAAMRAFDKGRTFMQEMRAKAAPPPLAKPEDPPPLEYTGPERQLAGKPNGRLS